MSAIPGGGVSTQDSGGSDLGDWITWNDDDTATV